MSYDEDLPRRLRDTAAEVELRHLAGQVGYPTHLYDAADELERLRSLVRWLLGCSEDVFRHKIDGRLMVGFDYGSYDVPGELVALVEELEPPPPPPFDHAAMMARLRERTRGSDS